MVKVLNFFVIISFFFGGCGNSGSIISKETISKHDLVDIQELDPTLLVELKYSTIDNFMETDVYGDLETCYMQRVSAEMLGKAPRNRNSQS